jgi:hypothetical protein
MHRLRGPFGSIRIDSNGSSLRFPS